MSSGLSANTQDRKARLAALKSLKRKQPSDDTPEDNQEDTPANPETSDSPTTKAPTSDVSHLLSGRNYDATTRAPKLGFETDPAASTTTLESRAQLLASTTKAEAEKSAAEDVPLDLFKLQPKKQNWDLKRDLDRKLEVLNVRTDNAVARLVRERIGERQKNLKGKAKVEGKGGEGDGEAVGMEGQELIEATHLREKEDEEDARREREADDELLDAS